VLAPYNTVMLEILLPLLLAVTPLPQEPPRVLIRTSPAEGLGQQSGIARLDPSDVIRIGEIDYVFYTKIERGEPLFPHGLAGTIWYARSEDSGHHWSERGMALGRSRPGNFDSQGVSDPSVLREPEGSVLLYYTGVGPELNARLERTNRVHRTRIGVARLEFDERGELYGVTRLWKGKALLEPSNRKTRRFDSLRIEEPFVLLIGERYHLYTLGRAFPDRGDRRAMGVATAAYATGPFVREYDGWPVIPEADCLCVLPYRGGALALLTQAQRGLWWAADGIHFAPTIARVEGRLCDPGVSRQATTPFWGIHVARRTPASYLERFELILPKELPRPFVTTIPVPSEEDRAQAAGWLGVGNWLGQHGDIIAIAKGRPEDYVFLGDSITQGWGGPGREVLAPGAEVWKKYWGEKDAANYGISGDRTQNLLWRIDRGEFLSARCKVVVVAIGTNNIGQDSPDAIAAGVAAVVQRLRQTVPSTKILLLSIFPRGESPDAPVRKTVCATNRLLAELGKEPRVTWCDLTSSFVQADGRLRSELYASDLLHLSPKGYEAWASVIDPVLDQLSLGILDKYGTPPAEAPEGRVEPLPDRPGE
jgi:lysophospholipase L1-like esterase